MLYGVWVGEYESVAAKQGNKVYHEPVHVSQARIMAHRYSTTGESMLASRTRSFASSTGYALGLTCAPHSLVTPGTVVERERDAHLID
jgi:hypothetical protein